MAYQQESLAYRANLYHALAEAVGPPSPWMIEAGSCWPLTQAVRELSPTSDAAREAIWHLAQIPAEPLIARQARYQALFTGSGRPRFWLHESMSRSGRLLGPETLAVHWLYQVCGLHTVGAELPDHASMELAFLSYLAGQQERDPGRGDKWRQLERQFIQKHAGCWLPQLGRALAADGDPVYGPIGRLLAEWLTEIIHPVPDNRKGAPNAARPQLSQDAACTLCGFCARVCPTHALAIHDTESETRLQLNASACIGCRKCAQICATHALVMGKQAGGAGQEGRWMLLRHSPRLHCPSCGSATVSQAEMDFVTAQIGESAWLARCQECRLAMMENN